MNAGFNAGLFTDLVLPDLPVNLDWPAVSPVSSSIARYVNPSREFSNVPRKSPFLQLIHSTGDHSSKPVAEANQSEPILLSNQPSYFWGETLGWHRVFIIRCTSVTATLQILNTTKG
jgi:hypothetical protein